MKSKTLSIKTRSHNRHNNRGRSYQRHHFKILTLSNSNHVRSRISNSRTTGFRNNSHGLSGQQRFQITGNIFRRSMFVQWIKSQCIYVNPAIYLFQKATCRAYIFYNKMFDAENDLFIIHRQHIFHRSFA